MSLSFPISNCGLPVIMGGDGEFKKVIYEDSSSHYAYKAI